MTAPKGGALVGPRSQARVSFHNNSSDVRSLWTLHQAAKTSRAVKRHLGPANKGTYLLVAALWESYCEDVLAETLDELIGATADPHSLPVAIRRAVAKDVRADPHELSPWVLAGTGWREVVKNRARRLCRETVFNSPKAGNVDELFRRTLGIQSITTSWTSVRATDPRSALDEHLVRRGELAHRAARTTIAKRQVSDFYQLTSGLAESMDSTLGNFLLDAVGSDPFAARDAEER